MHSRPRWTGRWSSGISAAVAVALVGCGGGDSGGHTTEPVVVLGSVSGSVVDGGGAGVTGVAVEMSRTGHTAHRSTTASGGAFSFQSVATGTWTVDVTPPTGFERDPAQAFPVAVTVSGNQTTSTTLRLKATPTTGTLRGKVSASGQGVAGAVMTLDAGATRTTDATGVYTFTDVAAGQHSVAITPPTGYVLATGEAMTKSASVAAGMTSTLDFQLASSTGGNVQVVHLTSNLSFSPSQLTITRGTTVRWVNDAAMYHTITPDGHSQWVEATLSSPSAIFEHTFNTAGTYNYYCDPHRSNNMTGRIVVQ